MKTDFGKIDTNLWISYLISRKYSFLDNLIISGQVKLVFSKELLDEFLFISQRPKFVNYFNKKDVDKLFDFFDKYSVLIDVKTKLDLCRDPNDNFILELAFDSKADYLITGDEDLLVLKQIGKTKIVLISEFRNILGV
ncbi:hypothetical protein MASR1M45_22630 [Candidatus Kapaibacterium sp.]